MALRLDDLTQDVDRREAAYRKDLKSDQQWYSLPRLMGRRGALWLWGEYVAEDITRLLPDRERDDFSALGMRPVIGKTYGSQLPCDVRILDCCAAFAALARLPNHHPARRNPYAPAPWTLSQLILYAYYAKGYGHRFYANPNAPEYYDEQVRRWGLDGKTGDAAIAHELRDLPELHRSREAQSFVYGRRRSAVAHMSRFLGARDDT